MSTSLKPGSYARIRKSNDKFSELIDWTSDRSFVKNGWWAESVSEMQRVFPNDASLSGLIVKIEECTFGAYYFVKAVETGLRFEYYIREFEPLSPLELLAAVGAE